MSLIKQLLQLNENPAKYFTYHMRVEGSAMGINSPHFFEVSEEKEFFKDKECAWFQEDLENTFLAPISVHSYPPKKFDWDRKNSNFAEYEKHGNMVIGLKVKQVSFGVYEFIRDALDNDDGGMDFEDLYDGDDEDGEEGIKSHIKDKAGDDYEARKETYEYALEHGGQADMSWDVELVITVEQPMTKEFAQYIGDEIGSAIWGQYADSGAGIEVDVAKTVSGDALELPLSHVTTHARAEWEKRLKKVWPSAKIDDRGVDGATAYVMKNGKKQQVGYFVNWKEHSVYSKS